MTTTLQNRTSVRVALYTKSSALRVDDTAGFVGPPSPLLATPPLTGSTVNSAEGYRDAGLNVVACQSQNAMAGGSFVLVLKVAPGADPVTLLEDMRNAWVDISYGKNGVFWHCMRGMVVDRKLQRSAAAAGPITNTLTITGRSFQRAYETTPLFFHPFLLDNSYSALLNVSPTQLDGAPEVNVQTILNGLFSYIGSATNATRANWTLPPSMPVNGATLAQAVTFDLSLVDDLRTGLSRQNKSCVGATTSFEGDNVWQLAQAFCDPMFCELYTELYPKGPGTPLQNLAADPTMRHGLDPAQASMTIVQRDKPFLLASADILRPVGTASSYFSLPRNDLFYDELTDLSLGGTDEERRNAFGVAFDLAATNPTNDAFNRVPIWNLADMNEAGLRRLDASSRYTAFNQDIGNYAAACRSLMRDCYCLSDRLYAGTLLLANPHPEMRVGNVMRLASRDDASPANTLEAYVEGVAHMWRFNELRTSVTFTRGFFGGTGAYLQTLAQQATQYTDATATEPKT